MADLPPSHPITQQPTDDGLADVTHPRRNFFGEPLQHVPVGRGPVTGFFRNGLCDASPLDPGSHTVAAVITPDFLDFSASQGNDLRPLFPTSGPLSPTSHPTASPCRWCLCASRWAQALRASLSHPLGERIVPRVILEATHERALGDMNAGVREGEKVKREELERFAVGGDGDASGLVGDAPSRGNGGNVGR